MFKKSRQKIVAVIMAILVILLAGTLCVIYTSSYVEVYQKNQNMLEHHIELFSLYDFPEGKDLPMNGPGPDIDAPPFEDDVVFQLSTFYSVAIEADGEVLLTDNISAVYSDEELEQIAAKVINGKSSGTYGSLVYRCAEKDGYRLVAFMDNTIMQESITTLFRYTLIFGGVAIIAIFFLACYFAKKIVQPLEESYQKQKQFISDAGHELKTPVSVVNANAEMLERQIGENQWLANIQHENARMGALVTQLLELARAENVTPQMETTDLSRIVTGEVLPFETVAFERGLELRSDLQDNITVLGNAGQLSQLTSILLDNAIGHSKTGRSVHITLRKERATATLSVTNEGDAIPAEQQKQLFERFYRTDEARTGGEGHYGLGLAIAKAIVAAHKGKIEVFCHDGLVEFKASIPVM